MQENLNEKKLLEEKFSLSIWLKIHLVISVTVVIIFFYFVFFCENALIIENNNLLSNKLVTSFGYFIFVFILFFFFVNSFFFFMLEDNLIKYLINNSLILTFILINNFFIFFVNNYNIIFVVGFPIIYIVAIYLSRFKKPRVEILRLVAMAFSSFVQIIFVLNFNIKIYISVIFLLVFFSSIFPYFFQIIVINKWFFNYNNVYLSFFWRLVIYSQSFFVKSKNFWYLKFFFVFIISGIPLIFFTFFPDFFFFVYYFIFFFLIYIAIVIESYENLIKNPELGLLVIACFDDLESVKKLVNEIAYISKSMEDYRGIGIGIFAFGDWAPYVYSKILMQAIRNFANEMLFSLKKLARLTKDFDFNERKEFIELLTVYEKTFKLGYIDPESDEIIKKVLGKIALVVSGDKDSYDHLAYSQLNLILQNCNSNFLSTAEELQMVWDFCVEEMKERNKITNVLEMGYLKSSGLQAAIARSFFL